jgi:hypothetical protein
VDYTTAAAAQETQLIDRQNALSVQESRLANAVSLIADLGGGWMPINAYPARESFPCHSTSCRMGYA